MIERRHGAILLLAAAAASGVRAQRAVPDEFIHLEPVLQAAIDKVAPSVVTVETFGGVRKVLAGGGPGVPADGPAPTPKKEPPGEKPEKSEKPGEKKPGEKKKPQKLGPIRQPGFLQAQGATTGVVLTSDGWILVSRFALNFDPTTILVTLPDGRSFNARRAGEDTSRGIALLKIEATGLPVPEFGSPEAIRIGQWAFVLGRTFGRHRPSVNMGIVSATDRLYGRALQTDANTSPANYGGPLIDVEGHVLGLSVPLSRSGRDAGAELYDSGVGFAASLTGIGPLLERMKRGDALHRGWLGVGTVLDDLGPGAELAQVAKGSPAFRAGLRPGDRVVTVDGVPVQNTFHLQNLVSSKMSGDRVVLQVVDSAGHQGEVEIELADLPEKQRKPQKPAEEAGIPPWEEGDPERQGR